MLACIAFPYATSTTGPLHPCSPVPQWYKTDVTLSEFLQIVPVTSQLSFGAAKAVDVAWSILIGRSGQALLLWISYHVYRACLIRLMESTTVPYALYMSLAFKEPDLSSIWRMSKFAFRRSQAWRHRFLMFWLVFSLFWVMSWQILTDAMTSYTASGDPYVQLVGGTFTSVADFTNSELAFQVIIDELYSDWAPSYPLLIQNSTRALQIQVFPEISRSDGNAPSVNEAVPVDSFQDTFAWDFLGILLLSWCK